MTSSDDPLPLPGDERGAADFEAFVREGAIRHKRLAYLLTGDLDRAEDLLHSAYAAMLPRWRRISSYDNPDAYLRRVMVNTRTSWWRRLRTRELVMEAPPDLPQRSWRDVADDVATSDELLTALRALPQRQRVTVVLRYYCDLSEEDVAAVMGCSPGTVKSNASRGLVALRLALNVTRPAGLAAGTTQGEGTW